jgi:hypothetical protein
MVYWTSIYISCNKEMVLTSEINILATSNAVVWCAMLCYAVLCCAVLCCAVLCSSVQFNVAPGQLLEEFLLVSI